MSFLDDGISLIGGGDLNVPISAPPLAAETASLIEEETYERRTSNVE